MGCRGMAGKVGVGEGGGGGKVEGGMPQRHGQMKTKNTHNNNSTPKAKTTHGEGRVHVYQKKQNPGIHNTESTRTKNEGGIGKFGGRRTARRQQAAGGKGCGGGKQPHHHQHTSHQHTGARQALATRWPCYVCPQKSACAKTPRCPSSNPPRLPFITTTTTTCPCLQPCHIIVTPTMPPCLPPKHSHATSVHAMPVNSIVGKHYTLSW